MSVESQNKSRINIKNRVLRLNPNEMTIKKSPAGASIGTSIALIKNMPKMSVISRTYLLMFGKKLNSALFLARNCNWFSSTSHDNPANIVLLPSISKLFHTQQSWAHAFFWNNTWLRCLSIFTKFYSIYWTIKRLTTIYFYLVDVWLYSMGGETSWFRCLRFYRSFFDGSNFKRMHLLLIKNTNH